MLQIRTSSLPRILPRAGLALVLALAGQAVFMPTASAVSLTVTSTADVATNFGACGNSGQTTSSGSLREAICAANNAGATSSTITVAAGTYTLANGELQMGKVAGSNITLTGAGAASTIINGNDASRVFNLDPNLVGGVVTTISGVTITGGRDNTFGGAGIIAGATAKPTGDTLTISNSIISGNDATGGSNAGGGVQFAGGNLTITNSTISNNTTNGAQGSGVWYRAEGTAPGEGLTISGTTFSGNAVSTSTVQVGGALAVDAQRSSPANFNVSNSRFTGNTATGSGAGTPVGAAIYAPSGILNVTESTFTGNAVAGGTSPAGGAIISNGATTTLHYNRFTGNTAPSGSALSATSGTVNATDNWWGCNTGPGTAGCDTVAGTATVSPRLVLTATASPATVVGPNATSTITATLTQNSLGSAIGTANLDAFAGLPIGFSDPLPSGATLDAASANLASGSASTSYNSQNTSGPGHVLATLDNGTATATVTVNRPPAITSTNTVTFTVGTAANFTVTTSGYPAPAITKTGTTPPGMTFTDNGNGTASLAGTPTAGGLYSLNLTANNGVNPTAIQTLSITVNQPAAFTSANSTTFTVGSPGSFTVTTTPTAYPTPSISRTGTLPSGLSFTDNGNGTATLAGTPAAGTGGVYPLSLTASNGVNPNGTQTLTVTVNQAPAVTTNPSNQTVNNGNSVSFIAAASGFPTPTVQWQRSTDGGANFTNIGGATSTTYTFTAASADNGNKYRAVFTNSTGSATSTAATLTVNTAPTISSSNTTTFTVGSAGTFTVTTTGFPNATLTTTGTLPAWLSFTDNGNGTATLAGTPPAGSGGLYSFTINADNGTAPADSQAFTLTVNESPTITSADHATFQVGSAGSFTVTTAAGFPVATALSKTGSLPSGVTFTDNGNGTATLSGTPASGTGGSYPITITASNGATTDATQSFTLTVTASPVFTSADHATFVTGSAGSFTVTTSGGAGPVTITETGTLPSGVTFTDNGDGTATLAGTPAAGTGNSYALTFTASDGITPNATQLFTLTVNQPPAITSADHATFTVGVADSFTVTTSPGVPAATTITKTGSLPAGVTFTDNGDGTATLAGTATAGGSFPITIKASNGVNPDDTQSFTLTVNQAPSITSADHTTFAVGSAGSFTVTTSPGVPAATTITKTGSLPSGVTFTDNGNGTATLAGTPAAGTGATYALTIKAENSTGSTTQSFTLTVTELPTFTSVNHASFILGTAGSFTVTTTAGFPVATTITETGTLPSGVSFTDNGDGTATLAGTPAAGTAGSYPLTISATNSAGTRQQSFTLTVTEAPAITSADHTTFTVGSAGSFTVTTSPAAATITRSGVLPAGVSFTDNGDGTATLAGTPAAGTGGTYGLTLSATNPSGTGNQTFTLTVNELANFTSGNSATFTIGNANSFTVTTVAGYPTATTITETGALPSGVSFTDNGDGTATLSGTPAAGTTGSYPLTISATNATGTRQQAFTLTVQPANSAPAITSGNSATFAKGSAGSFTVTTTGFPAPAITKTGSLPAGVSFTDNHNGTATIAGTPTQTGSFTITITANNGVSPNATQTFTLTVTAPPAITSGNTVTFPSNIAGSFTVTTTGFPTAAITQTGALPAGVTFTDNGNGTATIAGTPTQTTSSNYTLTITANNGIAPNATQTFTLKVTAVAAVALPASKPSSNGSLSGVPSTTYVNQVITVTGTGYKPGAPIEIGWYTNNGSKSGKLRVLAHGFANASGNFSIPVTVANDTGTNAVMSAGIGANGSKRYLSASTTVKPPLNASPLAGVPSSTTVGKTLTVSGAGYKAGASIEIGWYLPQAVARQVVADAAGKFSTTITVPNQTGARKVYAAGLGSDGKARYLVASTQVCTTSSKTGTSTTQPVTGTSTGGGGSLANTGLSDQRISAASAGALALTGLALMLVGRRRRRDEE